MVSEGKGRLFKRKDNKVLLYIPLDLAEDSNFPWPGLDSEHVKVSFIPGMPRRLVVEPWKESAEKKEG